jgi:hypothetical protein
MKAELSRDSKEVEVYIEEKDMCKSCEKAYRCSLIEAIKNSFVYLASSKKFVEDCWDWQPYEEEDKVLEGVKIV